MNIRKTTEGQNFTQSIEDNKTNVLSLFSLIFVLVILVLDYTYPMPRLKIISDIVRFALLISLFTTMFILAHQILPNFLSNHRLYEKYKKPLLCISLIITSLILAINIKVGGGIPISPYVSFLSSFPIFCMVLLFETITFTACLKGAGLIFNTIVLVYLVDYLLNFFLSVSIVVDESTLVTFTKSSQLVKLTVIILTITIISNICSIYFAAKEVRDISEES